MYGNLHQIVYTEYNGAIKIYFLLKSVNCHDWSSGAICPRKFNIILNFYN